MFKEFTVFQCHTPHGAASMYFGGIIYRFKGNYPESGIKNYLLDTSAKDKIYTVPFTFKQAIAQAKQYSMDLIVNLNEVIREDIPLVCPDRLGQVAGIVADILAENGFNDETAAITVINEPAERWGLSESKYLAYINSADRYVKGRFKLIIVNEEYHRFNEALIIPYLQNKSRFIWGVHHLSSLDKNLKNVAYAKTQANEWGIEIICNEGGSWFTDYQSAEGHDINIKLLEECKKYDYLGFSLCLPDINQEGKNIFKPLGYRIWTNDYSKIISQTNWDKFEEEIKKYQKGGEPPMPPQDRLIYYKVPNMTGTDVKEIEVKLRELGFDVTTDGVFTLNDKKSIEVFQELTHIVKDGIVGEQTKEKLNSVTSDTFYPEVFKPIWDKKDYPIELIDYFLSEKAHSNLHGLGKYFKQAEEETGIPIEWQLANAMQESGEKNSSGVFLIGQSYYGREWKNIYGWAIYDSGAQPAGKFPTYKDCILTVPKEIKRLYLTEGAPYNNGENIFGIEIKYSTAGHNAIRKAHYYRKICEFMDKGIRHKMPEYVEDLLPILDKYYKRKEE